MDEATIQRIPTRNLLQIHAAYVGALGGTDEALNQLQDDRRRIDEQIAQIEDHTKDLRIVIEMTTRKLLAVGFKTTDLHEYVLDINRTFARLLEDGSEADPRNETMQQPVHQPAARPQMPMPADRRPVRDHVEAAPDYVEDHERYEQQPQRLRREAPVAREEHHANYDGGYAGQSEQSIFDEMARGERSPVRHDDERPQSGGFGISPRLLEQSGRG